MSFRNKLDLWIGRASSSRSLSIRRRWDRRTYNTALDIFNEMKCDPINNSIIPPQYMIDDLEEAVNEDFMGMGDSWRIQIPHGNPV